MARYTAEQGDDGRWFVLDQRDNLPVKESYATHFEANLVAGRLNYRDGNTGLDVVLDDIRAERAAQNEKHGSEREQPDGVWLAVLSKKTGDAASALLVDSAPRQRDLRRELVEVAAVAAAWIEDLDRRVDL